ncbi:MAG: hypothetical protein AAGD88_05715 [Bacteroidota bacterium]
MKQLLFLIAILVCMASPMATWAQNDSNGKTLELMGHPLHIGAKAGAGLGQFSQPKSAFGGSLGAFARWQPLSFMDVQLEVLYELSGGGRGDLERDLEFLTDLTPDFTGSPADIASLAYLNRQVTFHSIKERLSARLTLPELQNGNIVPRVVLGVNSAIILSTWENHDAYYAFQDGTRIILSDQRENVGDNYTGVNVGAHWGMAVDYKLNNGRLFTMEVLFEKGFTDVNNILIGQPENVLDLRTQQLVVSFAYSIF